MTDDGGRLLTLHEVADRLSCSYGHVYVLVTTGALKSVDVAAPGAVYRSHRVRETDLAAFIEGRAA